MKKNLFDLNKILILFVAFILLNITPACAIQMQIAQEQPKINSNMIDDISADTKWFNTSSNMTKNEYGTIKSQTTIKNVVKNKKAYKTADNTAKGDAVIVKVDSSLNNELVVKDRIDNANKLHPKVKAQLHNATNALKALDIKLYGIKKEYNAASATQIELKNNLNDYVATTKNPEKYGEIQKHYESIHTTALDLQTNLNNLETQRKKLKMQINYLKNGLSDLEQIQSSDQKTSNGNVNSAINNYNDNVEALKKIDKTEDIGIKTSTTPNNNPMDNNTTADYEISTSEQPNTNVKTVIKEPQEPMMDITLYTSLSVGITAYVVGIGANAARFRTMNLLQQIKDIKTFLEGIETTKIELIRELTAEKVCKATEAKFIALGESDALVDVSSSGQTELLAGVASSSETGAATVLSPEVEFAPQIAELMSDISQTQMEEYLGFVASEEAVANALFTSKLIIGVSVAVIVIATICMITWLSFKFGWWRI